MARRSNLPPGVCRLTMSPWRGPVPMPGEYLATKTGRTAYLVLGIKMRPKAEGFHAEVERTSRANLPEEASIHWFIWNKRG